MKTLFRRLRRHQTALSVALLRTLTYGGLMALFFWLMSINNWYLLNPSRTLAITLVTYIAASAAMVSIYGGYAVGRRKSKPLICSLTLAALIVDAITYLQLQIMNTNPDNNAHLMLFGRDFGWLLLCMLLQTLYIIAMVYLGNAVYFRQTPPQRCLFVMGDPEQVQPLARKVGRYALQWRVTDVAMWSAPDLQERILQCDVVFLDSSIPYEPRQKLLHTCYALHRNVMCKAQLQDILIGCARQVVVDDAPFLEMDYHKMTLEQRIVKRLMDIVISATALLVLSPLLGVIAWAIHHEDGGPVLFLQQRMTIAGRTFTIFKFRTMQACAQAESATVDDQRITRVGRVLRRLRLDELPQLWNILRGDMTLVGPRPEMLENIARYKQQIPDFSYREKMKAGLTGYAQIEGRYNTTPEDKLMLDMMYIENFSLWEDVKLIFRTLTVFFKGDSTAGFVPGASAPSKRERHHDEQQDKSA